MANATISDLPTVTLPINPNLTIVPVDVQANVNGPIVTQKMSVSQIMGSTQGIITGTSMDDPSVGGGTFDGVLQYQNALGVATANIGFLPTGDDIIIQNLAQDGTIELRVRDGTVLAQTTTAALGGLFVNNLNTGAGLERVLTTSDASAALPTGTFTDSSVIDLVDANVAVRVGAVDPTAAQHLEMDPTSLQSKSNGTTAATLTLNPVGGDVQIAPTGGAISLSLAGGTVTVGGTGAGTQNLNVDAVTGQDARLNLLENGVVQARILHDASANLFRIQSGNTGDAIQIEEDFGTNISATFTPNGAVSLRFQNVEAAVTTEDGLTVSNTEGAGFTGELRVLNGGGDAGQVFKAGSGGNFGLRNVEVAGNISLEALATGSINRQVFDGDPDGISQLFNIGVATARTTTAANGGLEANNLSTGAGFERVLTTADALSAGAQISGVPVDNQLAVWVSATAIEGTANLLFDNINFEVVSAADADRAIKVRNSIGGAELRTFNASGSFGILQTDAAGVLEDTWIAMTRNSEVQLNFNNARSVTTQLQGLEIRSTSGTSTIIDMEDTGGTLEGRIQTQSAGQMLIRAELNNRGVRLMGTDSVGADAILLDGLPDGSLTGYFDNSVAFLTDASGITIRDTSGSTAAITFATDAGVQNGVIFTENGTDGLTLRSNLHGGFVVLDGEDDAGGVNRMVVLDPNGNQILSDCTSGAAVERFRTITTGILVSGTSGAVFELNRTDNSINSHIEYSGNSGTSVFAGMGPNGVFVIGDAIDLSLTANQFIRASATDVRLSQSGVVHARTNTLGTNGAFQVTDDGTDFQPVRAPRVAKKNSATSRTNGTSFSADPNMSLVLAAGNYKVTAWVVCQATGSASDIVVGLAWSGAVNDTRGVLWTGPVTGGSQTTTGQTRIGTLQSAPAQQSFGVVTSTATSHLIKCDCLFDANGSGTLAVHWTSASANAVNVVAQSRLEATLIEP